MKDMDLIGLVLDNETMVTQELNRKYGAIFRRTIQDVLGNNIDLVNTCIDTFYKKMKWHLFLYDYKVSLPTHLNALLRNEIMDFLRDGKDISYLSDISDIAVMYSGECGDYSCYGTDSSKIDLCLSRLSKKKVEFVIRRYYYLQDKNKILREMKLRDNKFEKIKNAIEHSFGCNTINLVKLMKGINLKYLEKYNKKVNSDFTYDDADKIVSIGDAERERREWVNKNILIWSALAGICFIISMIIKLLYW